jgi:hypothetical protein
MVIEYEGNEEDWKGIFISYNSEIGNKKVICLNR